MEFHTSVGWQPPRECDHGLPGSSSRNWSANENIHDIRYGHQMYESHGNGSTSNYYTFSAHLSSNLSKRVDTTDRHQPVRCFVIECYARSYEQASHAEKYNRANSYQANKGSHRGWGVVDELAFRVGERKCWIGSAPCCAGRDLGGIHGRAF